METKETDRVVIAKPVASRPTGSNFQSFSELLAGAINSSPPDACTESAVATIRPKTVRFKPVLNRVPTAVNSSQAEVSGTATGNSTDMDLNSDEKPTIIYKPLAKLVSRSTISLLANMGSFNTAHQQTSSVAEARVKSQLQDKHNSRSQPRGNLHRSVSTQADMDGTSEPLRLASQNMEEDARTLPALNVDRPSYDGYNWRKYGQKQVKGSEYPRSYYKCTHPNCPVKKKVERSPDGQIAEIVYKGEHNHPKPQPPKRGSSGTQALGNVLEGSGLDSMNLNNSGHPNERDECSEGRVENKNLALLTSHGKGPPAYDPIANVSPIAGGGTPDNSCGISGEYDDGSKELEMEDDEPKNKRRKSENQLNEPGTSGEAIQEPRAVQNSTDSEIVGDGFRWRKYGQKVVKGNPYPRSYYRCTSLKCNVRKHVERASDDPRAFITTYEGKHNHEMPLRSTNTAGSESDLQATSSKDKP
ncbi:WRKY transcription factor 44-like isoform X1 [Rhodamnia argentea]|uniref:WRKY transcription factor 44-like isoform X1 n=2 Tax=Rhodamnia argentea TaxID=178133 RepID=A0A8B8NIU3_9MYRT|nr:WRKY transcription factor 44-like isoform X1 [Rhodamnia argentea]XP_030522034.1 WRKY transcription factor 44-like isoform X1 [Rhodamnia argentea]XP_048127846.1 WRKY transcription factor 44-like isoform X1 [Rhodamnia argentea]